METLYHLTYKSNVEKILKEGLIPQTGDNAKFAGENYDGVYLCRRQDMPFWKVILGVDVALLVEQDNFTPLCWKYQYFNDYVVAQTIPPDQIQLIGEIPRPTKTEMSQLCLMYLDTLSFACSATAEYYDGNKAYVLEDVGHYLESFQRVMKRLDYTTLSTLKIMKKANEIKKECRPFCSEYKNTGRMMWEQLAYYPRDELTPLRMDIYKYVGKNLNKDRTSLYKPKKKKL